MLGSIGTNLWVSALVVVVFFTLVLGISVLRGRHDTVDTAWGLAFAVVAIASLLLSAGQRDLGASIAWRRYLITGLTIVWGVRLAVHLHLRNGPRGEDPRYQRILASAKGSPLAHAVRKVYLPQAAFAWVISLPLQVGQYSTGRDPVSLTLYLGVALWLVGFGFEAIGDAQLSSFGKDPANKGTVLSTGLWRYTRHPNYFGDACLWWGLWVLAAHSVPGLISIIAPLIMSLLLARGTGKPLLERGMARTREGYADYVRRTSGFFPLPPKKTVPSVD